jgi:hypothetical protein
MRTDRPVEGGYRSAFSSHCGDQRSFIILILIWPPSWNKSISTSAYSG